MDFESPPQQLPPEEVEAILAANPSKPWLRPDGWHAGWTPRDLRKLTKNLPKKVHEQQVTGPEARVIADRHWHCNLSESSRGEARAELHQWLSARGHHHLIKNHFPLAELWTRSRDHLPENLQLSPAGLPPEVVFPKEDEWLFYPTHWAPPCNAEVHKRWRCGKEVPIWEPGWWLTWHGTNMYCASVALKYGMLCPSEETESGHRTACGRGLYTTFNAQMACRYAISHNFLPGDPWMVKCIMLVAVAGMSGKDGVANWAHDPNAKKGHRFKLQSAHGDVDVQWRRDRATARKVASAMEPDWTNNAPGFSQQTSSRGYPLGFAFGIITGKKMKWYGQEGPSIIVHCGWKEALEVPMCRPLRNHDVEMDAITARQTKQKKKLKHKRDAKKRPPSSPRTSESSSS